MNLTFFPPVNYPAMVVPCLRMCGKAMKPQTWGRGMKIVRCHIPLPYALLPSFLPEQTLFPPRASWGRWEPGLVLSLVALHARQTLTSSSSLLPSFPNHRPLLARSFSDLSAKAESEAGSLLVVTNGKKKKKKNLEGKEHSSIDEGRTLVHTQAVGKSPNGIHR